MSVPSKSQSPASYYQPAPGGNGFSASVELHLPLVTVTSHTAVDRKINQPAEGDLIITPNEIGVYGGGGSGHVIGTTAQSDKFHPPAAALRWRRRRYLASTRQPALTVVLVTAVFLAAVVALLATTIPGMVATLAAAVESATTNKASGPINEVRKAGHGVVIIQYARRV